VNADGRPDLLALNWGPAYVVWYENPTPSAPLGAGWKRRVLIQREPKELVAIEPLDVDGDGKTEFVLGAGYKEPPEPKSGGGEVYLLRRPTSIEAPWIPEKIAEAPTLHRIHRLDAKSVVCSALHGPTFVLRRGADGWARETVAERLSACHNTLTVDWDGDGAPEVLTASREGLQLWKRGDAWTPTLLFRGNGGVSEVAVGRLPGGGRWIATIEPHHGAELCLYVGGERRVLLVNKGGHTLQTVAFDAESDCLLAGFVGQYSNAPGGPIWHLFRPGADGAERRVLDDTKLPGEDGVVADLDGDGRPDLVLAGGKRVKVWWNAGRK
jgi:hypothetical protein